MEFGLCIEMALTHLPFEQRLAKAAEIGFKNVEMWLVGDNYKGTPEHLAEVAAKAGVRVTNTVIGPPDGSIGGGLTNPARREDWLARARMTFDFNKRANIPATIVCTGNTVDGMSDAEMEHSVLDGLKATVDLAEKEGITLLLEPLNLPYDHKGYWLDSSDRGADLVRRIGSKHFRLLFDCYHMQIMEGDLVNHIRRNLDTIGHFHSAGVPGRFEHYNGEINYPFLIAEIEKMGYTGIFGLEYQPSIKDQEASVRNVLKHLTV
ncbi:MAG TPA: TIM barrel protein [Candidatus Hydrogenedentes bacterium]|nr:TIM barrel protein [Candidatus Hydrogenedentota bacterium]